MASPVRALDINARDYRAWYGLGQTYELLNMFHYALYYYRKAVTLRLRRPAPDADPRSDLAICAAATRPTDARMWTAMGSCFKKLSRTDEAIRSFERASSNNDQEGIATFQLANLYKERQEHKKAAECYLKVLPQAEPKEAGEALEFLAQFYKNNGEYDTARKYCLKLQQDCPGMVRDGRGYPRHSSLISSIPSCLDAGGSRAGY